MITINMIKEKDCKHSVQFKPATDADKTYCSAFYLARPASDGVRTLRMDITTDRDAALESI